MKANAALSIIAHRSTRPTGCRLMTGLALFVVGCSNSQQGIADRHETGGATPQTFRNVSMDACLDAAAVVIREQFGDARVSANDGVVHGGPQSFTQRGGTARVTDPALKPNYKMRRFGTVWLTQSDGGITANCQVRVQRLDTTDYRTFQTHDEFNDLPTATPIDDDAGLRADQREVWTDLPRDNTMERQLLGAVYRRLHGLSGDVDAAAAPQE